MPSLPSNNPMATVYAIAEKAAALITGCKPTSASQVVVAGSGQGAGLDNA
jgi:choline dehydrogenase-like flavoprotein